MRSRWRPPMIRAVLQVGRDRSRSPGLQRFNVTIHASWLTPGPCWFMTSHPICPTESSAPLCIVIRGLYAARYSWARETSDATYIKPVRRLSTPQRFATNCVASLYVWRMRLYSSQGGRNSELTRRLELCRIVIIFEVASSMLR